MEFKHSQDIVFIINPSQWYGHMYPTGILSLSAYLRQNNLDNLILDSSISKNVIKTQKAREKALVKKIIALKPKIICYSTTHKQFIEVIRLNQIISKKLPKSISIIGGSQPTYRASDFLNHGFKFVGVGEGEKTLLEFVELIKAKDSDYSKIKGLAYRYKNRIIINSPRTLMSEKELNKISLPPYDKIDSRYFDINGGTIRGFPLKSALILTTRGCPYNCSYCGCNLIFGRKLRYRSIKNIESEIKNLVENQKVEGVWIVDDTFTINLKHVKGICKILKKYNLIWGCQSRVNTINE